MNESRNYIIESLHNLIMTVLSLIIGKWLLFSRTFYYVEICLKFTRIKTTLLDCKQNYFISNPVKFLTNPLYSLVVVQVKPTKILSGHTLLFPNVFLIFLCLFSFLPSCLETLCVLHEPLSSSSFSLSSSKFQRPLSPPFRVLPPR